MQLPGKQNVLAFAFILLTVFGCSSSSDSNKDNTNDLVEMTSNLVQSDGNQNTGDSDGSSAGQNGSESGSASETDVNEGTAINSTNFEQLAKSVIDAINTNRMDKDRLEAEALLDKIYESGLGVINGNDALAGLTLTSQEEESESVGSPDTIQTYTCDQGGSLVLLVNDFNGAPIYSPRVTFENCALNGQSHNGRLEYNIERRSHRRTNFFNYSVTSADRTVELTGEYIDGYEFCAQREALSWTESDYEVSKSTDDFKIDNFNWKRAGFDSPCANGNGFVQLPNGTAQLVLQYTHSAELEASFNFTSEQTLLEKITVFVDLTFTGDYLGFDSEPGVEVELPNFPAADLGDPVDVYLSSDLSGNPATIDNPPKTPEPQWQSGEIRMTAIDGSSLVITPDAADPASVLVELNGSGEPVSRLWSEGYQVDCSGILDGCGQVE